MIKSTSPYHDKELTCQDCGNTFTFTARDQEFYEKNGFKEPKRCKSCRDKRKQARNNQ